MTWRPIQDYKHEDDGASRKYSAHKSSCLNSIVQKSEDFFLIHIGRVKEVSKIEEMEEIVQWINAIGLLQRFIRISRRR